MQVPEHFSLSVKSFLQVEFTRRPIGGAKCERIGRKRFEKAPDCTERGGGSFCSVLNSQHKDEESIL